MKRTIVAALIGLAALSAILGRAAGDGRVIWAGVRSSRYGIKPFPSPEGWVRALETMRGHFPGSAPMAIWIVGQMTKERTSMRLLFPSGGAEIPHVVFDAVDPHEHFLDAFDKAGVGVFLQVEPADADVGTLIDAVLGRYKRHPCVAGFGVDVEWYRIAHVPKTGMKVDDATAMDWEARVKAHGPAYRLFLKHWDAAWMPPSYRGDIVFVDDSQDFESMDAMVAEFQRSWAPAFHPNTVVFQVGYGSDKPWWSKLAVPPRELGAAIARGIAQDLGIIWVDFSLRDVLPAE